LVAKGRRADALKHYEHLAALLKRELNVAPDASTQAVVLDLRQAAAPVSEFPPLPDKPSIAVLPFANMSGDEDQEYFADGIVEDILTALSHVRWLFVIARQSSFSYRGRAVGVVQIGRELGVRYVVEGSVRKSGNRVRITAQLVEAGTGAHLWAERYERDLMDIFALQDEITERIVAAIEPNIRAVEIKRARTKPTENLTAYDLYLRALPDYHAQSEQGIKRAEGLLRKAIELDPEYPEALGTLADCLTTRTLNGWHESVTRGGAEACEFARRALAAGPDNSTCVASAAFAYANLGHRFEQALELAARAIELHPNSAFVRNRAGAVYGASSESDKAIAQHEAALRMNPRDTKSSTFAFTAISGAHFFTRRFEEAIHWGRRAIAVVSAANVARRNVAASLAHLGRMEEARAEIAELLRHQPNASLTRSRLSSFRYDWMYDLYLGGLRKAGLPEN
jgi:adenylate cyclase